MLTDDSFCYFIHEHQKYIFTLGSATRKNTAFDVHSVKKYTEKKSNIHYKFYFQAANLKAPIDERVNLHVQKLVCEGITNSIEIQRNVKVFVKNLFGSKLPQVLNRRFYPSREDIRKIVYREKKRLMEGKLDQERLREKVLEWTEENSENVVFYRPKSTEEAEHGGDRFMFLFQSEWQRRLLAKYSNKMVFLDATYRTTKYALPLFFLCVHTNCGYFVVASIIIENEESASLAEAFEKLKEVNASFQPQAFIIDASEIEMNAIKMSFPIYLSMCACLSVCLSNCPSMHPPIHPSKIGIADIKLCHFQAS